MGVLVVRVVIARWDNLAEHLLHVAQEMRLTPVEQLPG